MGLVLVTKQLLSNIANAIRTINGSSNTYTLANMPNEITQFKKYGYTLLDSTEITANTTSTTAVNLGNIVVPSAWIQSKMIYVRIRDKAGKRSGYFYGSDNWIFNANLANGTTNATSLIARMITRYTTDNQWAGYSGSYGIYVYDINTSGRIRFSTRYHETYSLTINGTYIFEVYAVEWPDNVSVYDAPNAITT